MNKFTEAFANTLDDGYPQTFEVDEEDLDDEWQQKGDDDPKRRRRSAPATIRPRGKPSIVVFPGEEIPFPEEVDPAFGWTEIKQTLFKEWQLY